MSAIENSEQSGRPAEAAEAGNGGAASGCGLRFLTREELANVLQISVRTVDQMLAGNEIPCVRLRGVIVRFYLPDVVRTLTATAVTSKRRCARRRLA